jgi:hypothetical protein
MKGKLCLGIASAVALALLAGTARAADDDFDRPGPYVGAGAAGGFSAFQGSLKSGKFDDSVGFDVRAGYRFPQHLMGAALAAEGVYEYMDDFGSAAKFGSSGDAKADIRTNNFSVMGKLILPIQRFQPYLTGGVGFLEQGSRRRLKDIGLSDGGSDQDIEFAGRFGGGVDVYLTQNVSLDVDTAYVIPRGGLSDMQYFSLSGGAQYHF